MGFVICRVWDLLFVLSTGLQITNLTLSINVKRVVLLIILLIYMRLIILKFMLINQNHEDLPKSENFWIRILSTNQKGLNDNHDFFNNDLCMSCMYKSKILFISYHSDEGCDIQSKI